MKCTMALCTNEAYLKVTFEELFTKAKCGDVTHYFCPYHSGFIQAIQDLSKQNYKWEKM